MNIFNNRKVLFPIIGLFIMSILHCFEAERDNINDPKSNKNPFYGHDIIVTPSSHDFGNVNMNTFQDQTFTISSRTGEVVGFDGVTSNQEHTFQVMDFFSSGPVELQSYETRDFSVEFHPTVQAYTNAEIMVTYRTTTQPSRTIYIGVSGTGINNGDVGGSSLIAYWNFEEGPPAPDWNIDLNNYVKDVSNANHDGLIENHGNGSRLYYDGDVMNTGGINGGLNSLFFSSGGTNYPTITIGSRSEFDFSNNNSMFTVQFAVKIPTSVSHDGDGAIVSKWRSDSNACWLIGARQKIVADPTDDEAYIFIRLSPDGGEDLSDNIVYVSSSNIADNEWHYVVCTIDIANKEYRIYIDGTVDTGGHETGSETASDFTKIHQTAMAAVNIGGSDNNYMIPPDMWLDEVKIFNIARQPNELQADYFGPYN